MLPHGSWTVSIIKSALPVTCSLGKNPLLLRLINRTARGKEELCWLTIQITWLQRWLWKTHCMTLGSFPSNYSVTVWCPPTSNYCNSALWLVGRPHETDDRWHSNGRIPWLVESCLAELTYQGAIESHHGSSDLQRENISTSRCFAPQRSNMSLLYPLWICLFWSSENCRTRI